MNRKAGVGVATMIILLFSIVCFAGSLFYLAFYNPWNLTNQPPSSHAPIITQEEITEPVIDENKSLEAAIQELKYEGCNFVSVKAKVYLSDPQYLCYNDFKLKALETNLVVMSPSDSGIILLVQKEDTQWIWLPP